MATILRTWSYQYPWLYAFISRLAALTAGGETCFHQLPLRNIPPSFNGSILDLCCGGGQAIAALLEVSPHVTGLDASPTSLERAKKQFPQVQFVRGLAEKLPFAGAQFDLVHSSAALHEMTPAQRQEILAEVFRVLKPGGCFVFVDFHRPHNSLFFPPFALFLELFETETAWQWIDCNILSELAAAGFASIQKNLYAGGSLQVVQATR